MDCSLEKTRTQYERELFPLPPSKSSPPSAVTKHKPRNDSFFSRDNPFQRNSHRRPQPQRQLHLVPPHLNQKNGIQPSSCISPQQIPHHAFLKKSQWLKHNLIWTINEALNQIDQWLPTETLDKDAMDWQPEDEIVIPQRDNTVYTYGNRRDLEVAWKQRLRSWVRRQSCPDRGLQATLVSVIRDLRDVPKCLCEGRLEGKLAPLPRCLLRHMVINVNQLSGILGKRVVYLRLSMPEIRTSPTSSRCSQTVRVPAGSRTKHHLRIFLSRNFSAVFKPCSRLSHLLPSSKLVCNPSVAASCEPSEPFLASICQRASHAYCARLVRCSSLLYYLLSSLGGRLQSKCLI